MKGLILLIKTKTLPIIKYLNEYKLIYIGVILCHLCCFNFYRIINIGNVNEKLTLLLIILFFFLSFILPITFGISFIEKCFVTSTRKKVLSNIIHSYFGIIFIFTALYYQSVMMGDFNDSVRKTIYYEGQVQDNRFSQDFKITEIVDTRAFIGIKKRMWSGYDYPNDNLRYGINDTVKGRKITSDYSDIYKITTEQIENFVKSKKNDIKVIEYQSHNWSEVYFDCLFFSVMCVSVGSFGDITPNLWYTKLFTMVETLFGISIFILAIGMLFGNWIVKNLNSTHKCNFSEQKIGF